MRASRALFSCAILFAGLMASGCLVPSVPEMGSAAAAAGSAGDVHEGAGVNLTVEPGRAALVRLSLPEATNCRVVVESEGGGLVAWYGSDVDQPLSVLVWGVGETSPLLSLGTPAASHRVERPEADNSGGFVRYSTRSPYDAGEHHVLVGSDTRRGGQPVSAEVACESPTATTTVLAEGQLLLVDSHDFQTPTGVGVGDTLLVTSGQTLSWESTGPWLAGYFAVVSWGEFSGSLQHEQTTQSFRIGDVHGRWFAGLGAHANDPMPVWASQDGAGVGANSLLWFVSWDAGL